MYKFHNNSEKHFIFVHIGESGDFTGEYVDSEWLRIDLELSDIE